MSEDRDILVPLRQHFVPPGDTGVLLLPKAGEKGTIGDILAGQRARETPSPLAPVSFYMTAQIWLKPHSCELVQAVAEGVGSGSFRKLPASPL